jgi:pyruvate dehydrogenase (quinone)
VGSGLGQQDPGRPGVKTDPEVPPLPPHITLQQAKKFSIALAKSDPDEIGVIRGKARQVLETILPGKE